MLSAMRSSAQLERERKSKPRPRDISARARSAHCPRGASSLARHCEDIHKRRGRSGSVRVAVDLHRLRLRLDLALDLALVVAVEDLDALRGLARLGAGLAADLVLGERLQELDVRDPVADSEEDVAAGAGARLRSAAPVLGDGALAAVVSGVRAVGRTRRGGDTWCWTRQCSLGHFSLA